MAQRNSLEEKAISSVNLPLQNWAGWVIFLIEGKIKVEVVLFLVFEKNLVNLGEMIYHIMIGPKERGIYLVHQKTQGLGKSFKGCNTVWPKAIQLLGFKSQHTIHSCVTLSNLSKLRLDFLICKRRMTLALVLEGCREIWVGQILYRACLSPWHMVDVSHC